MTSFICQLSSNGRTDIRMNSYVRQRESFFRDLPHSNSRTNLAYRALLTGVADTDVLHIRCAQKKLSLIFFNRPIFGYCRSSGDTDSLLIRLGAIE